MIAFVMEGSLCLVQSEKRQDKPDENAEYAKIQEAELFAKSAVLMDGVSGRILYSKNGNAPLANASTTKILSCIVALENADLQTICVASERASRQPKVRLGVAVGTEIMLKHLLYSMMLESHNDSSVMVAETVGGDVETFAQLMNQKAKDIGCKDSYFITPNGLDDVNEGGKHHTTAEDLSRIMRYCVLLSPKKEQFIKICQSASYDFTDQTGHAYHCQNHNAFLTMVQGVLAGKTGFTGDAGYCYTCGIESQGRYFIISLLACGWPNNKTYKWKDASRLLSFGQEHYQNQELNYNSISPVPAVDLQDWGNQSYHLSDSRNIYPKAQENKETILLADWEQVHVKYDLPQAIQAPVLENAIAGYRNIYINQTLFRQQEMVYEQEYPARNYDWYFKSILKEWEFAK